MLIVINFVSMCFRQLKKWSFIPSKIKEKRKIAVAMKILQRQEKVRKIFFSYNKKPK